MDVSTDDNCRLWTAETGRGEPLIMCHGGPGLWDMSGSLAARLAERLTVIRWDQRGCGRSERRGPYSVARCVADLDAIFGQRTKAALFGHSWGATLRPGSASTTTATARSGPSSSGPGPRTS